MSKRHPKEPKRKLCKTSAKFEVNSIKNDGNFVLEIVIGSINVKRWNQLKITLSCTTNEELATFLLDLAERYLKENKLSFLQSEIKTLNKTDESNSEEADDQILSKNEGGKRRKTEDKETDEIIIKEEIKIEDVDDIKSSKPLLHDNSEVPINSVINDNWKSQENTIRKHCRKDKESRFVDKRKKESNNYDIRKAPELNEQIEEKTDSDGMLLNDTDACNQRVATKIKLCYNCGTLHVQDQCPLQNPHFIVCDSLKYEEWLEKYKPLYDEQLQAEELHEDKESITFAFLSLPPGIHLNDVSGSEDLCVVTSLTIKEFTQFGPLFGKTVKEVDILEDSNMKHLWEIYSEKSHIYISTENLDESNWIRFVRPAPTRDKRNVIAISKNCELFLISTKEISAGEELMYWQDDLLNTTKKKMKKTTCGGCNITFSHPIYYRTHCSIFHDIRYHLNIRKYHCKICGVAVLGKENIKKHAAELHNGQGAYQCQFCKKFFLHLNYLEMHRTYGCSANPHRSRLLCNFCGRRFCQPQKLKDHIKRMHSDLSEVLKEFQCKSCLKLLGSRDAVQRHMKEIHNKQLNGACACSRCGKLFQNKSNLKIHMLTHSGIKPFRCTQGNCNAAFTTKQSLQFHYKNVHSFTDDMIPKIKRSVDYTLEAYSGDRDQEGNIICKMPDSVNENHFSCLNDVSDDENSLDDKNLDDPLALCSPTQLTTPGHSSLSNLNPPALETYSNTNLKILSKGSKKWLGDDPLPTLKNEIYQDNKINNSDITLDVNDQHTYDRSQDELSNVSLLMEAALDSPGVSPPRYNFGHSMSAEHVSSDDSNGMSAQKLNYH